MLRHMPRILETCGGSRHAGYINGGHRLIPIPIARERIGDWLIPRCSSPILPAPASEWTQRFARPMVTDHDLIAERRKINTSSGPNKSCLLPLRSRLVEKIVWFAVAETDSSKGHGLRKNGKPRGAASPLSCIKRRLKKINTIGSKASQGHGVVSRWEVELVDDDWSWFAKDAAGQVLMRPLPRGDWLPDNLLGAKVSFDRPCGPYHDKAQACEVVKPC